MPSQLQKHLRSRAAWLGVVFLLNFAVSIAAAMLARLDYAPFSRFFENHKHFIFCLVANLFCVAMLAPALGLAVSLGRDIAAGFKNMVGGELKGYTELLTESRREAMTRMIAQAEALGANAVVNVRFSTSAITSGASEMMAYGTAVVAE